MTIEKIATISNFQGIAADISTAWDDEPPAGSTFHAIDTGDEFIRYADGWVLDLRKASMIRNFQGVLADLDLRKASIIRNFQGMLADLNIFTDSTEYPAGSIFHAVDTGDEFVRYADRWVLDLRKAAAIKRSLML